MATDAERDLFAEKVLATVGRHGDRLARTKVTGFLAMAGQAYDGGLMVVGRAVNGWTDGVFPSDLRAPDSAGLYAARVQESVAGNGNCPMRWVKAGWGAAKGYNTRRSAFWRCIRNVVQGLRIVDVESAGWSSHLVWTNLYKVSPAHGGNPNNALCEIQLAGCVELFKLEIRTYRPFRVLFLTGADWAAPFLEGVNLQEGAGFHHVKGVGQVCDARFVIALHPQCKPEREWVREVVTAFDR